MVKNTASASRVMKEQRVYKSKGRRATLPF